MNLKEFISALQELKIDITDQQLRKLETYYELLIQYNKVMNLTGITEKEAVYLKHFYDSLTIARVYDLNRASNLCDIGTGAGFPGMVLKILYPNLEVTLVDSLHKRVEFLKVVIQTLGLEKIEVIATRAEDYAQKNRNRFDVVTARAVAPLSMLLEYCIPIVKVGGYFIPMKGSVKREEEETRAFTLLHTKIEKIDNFFLPKENSNRTLYLIRKELMTPLEYPRKFSDMKKRPL